MPEGPRERSDRSAERMLAASGGTNVEPDKQAVGRAGLAALGVGPPSGLRFDGQRR